MPSRRRRLGLITIALAVAAASLVSASAPALGDPPAPPGNPTLAPIITTPSIVAVDRHSFTVTATVNPNGSAGSYRIDYGTTAGYGLISDEVHFPAATATLDVTITVSGLEPGVTYYFRLAANNIAGGTVFGPDQTVTTQTSDHRHHHRHRHRHRHRQYGDAVAV